MLIRNLMKKTAMLMAVFGLLSVPALVVVQPALAIDSKEVACEGIGLSGGDCDDDAAMNEVNDVVNNIVDLLSVIVGIAAVIMIIIAGFKYITSGGDSSSVASAKGTLIWAIIGIVVVALAQFIVRFVLRQTTS